MCLCISLSITFEASVNIHLSFLISSFCVSYFSPALISFYCVSLFVFLSSSYHSVSSSFSSVSFAFIFYHSLFICLSLFLCHDNMFLIYAGERSEKRQRLPSLPPFLLHPSPRAVACRCCVSSSLSSCCLTVLSHCRNYLGTVPGRL